MSASAKEETDSKSDSNQANNGLSINNHKQNSEQSNIAAKGSEQPEQSTTPNGPKSIGKPVLAVAAVLVLLAFLFVFNRKPVQDPNIVDINGRIEAPETYITAGVGTHVQSVNVQEGDIVHRGQVLLALDSKALRVKMQATGSEEQLAMQAQGQADKQVQLAQNDVDQARAKSKGFFAKIFGSKKKKEEEKARLTSEMKAAEMQLFQAKAAVIKSHAAKGEVSSKVSFFTITSPIDGLCVTRSVEPGEAVAPGQVLLSIIDPGTIYMKGFIPEGNLSQVKIGQKATVILDGPAGSNNDKNGALKLAAHVTAIDTSPSFTPQNIYFKEDRIKQVFGIKLMIDKPDGRAKPGMSAEAKIMLDRSKQQ